MSCNKDNAEEKTRLVSEPLKVLKSGSIGRIVFFFLVLITNFMLAGFFIYEMYIENELVVSTYLLIIFGVNTAGYFTYYFTMKYYHRIKFGKSTEAITLTSWIYICMAILFGIIGMMFLIGHQEKATKLSPSESRHLNAECTFSFFDKHDIWHFISAFSVLFTFMALLTLEDNNTSTPWNEISVF